MVGQLAVDATRGGNGGTTDTMRTAESEEFHLRSFLIPELGQHPAEPWLGPIHTHHGRPRRARAGTHARARLDQRTHRDDSTAARPEEPAHTPTLIAPLLPVDRLPSALLEWLTIRPQLP